MRSPLPATSGFDARSLVRIILLLRSVPSESTLSLLQADIFNQNGNNNYIIGGGAITNNNWVTNNVQIEEEQVSHRVGGIARRSHTLYNRRRP